MRTLQKAGALRKTAVLVAALTVPLITLTACGSEESSSSDTPTTTVTRTHSRSVKPSNTAESQSQETQDVDQESSYSEVPTVTIGSQADSQSSVTTITMGHTPVTSTAKSRGPAEPSASSLSTPTSRSTSQEDRPGESVRPSQGAQAAGEPMMASTFEATTVVNSNQESYTFTNPTCDGHYIVVVGNYVPSGSFDGAELDEIRAQYPGAMVAQSGACGSLAGESYPIYFDYGWDGAAACAQTIPGARPKVAGPEGSPNPCSG